jgi:two-component system response regulator AtoC
MCTYEKRVLIIDDEEMLTESLMMFFSEKKCKVECAFSGKEGIEKFMKFHPHLVFLDVKLPDMDGLEVLKKIKHIGYDAYIVIITAYHEMDIAIKAMQLGAFDYLIKPLDVNEIDRIVEKAFSYINSYPSVRIEEFVKCDFEDFKIIGRSKSIKEILKTIGIVSQKKVNVFIEGETGTGKELVARAIHFYSPFKEEPFVAINCACIVPTLFESELFGYEKGAFTGALRTTKGKLEIVGEGTLFLDEVGELSCDMQAKLLRVLEEREFERVGGSQKIPFKARVIAATNRDIEKLLKEGKFREDLFYRLSVVRIKIPPLRERIEDLPLLIRHLIGKLAKETGKFVKGVEDDAIKLMSEYEWPGNVRELQNVLLEALLRTQGSIILKEDIQQIIEERRCNSSKKDFIPAFDGNDEENKEKEKILEALNKTNWHRGKAATLLGISRPTLRKKMRELGILNK